MTDDEKEYVTLSRAEERAAEELAEFMQEREVGVDAGEEEEPVARIERGSRRKEFMDRQQNKLDAKMQGVELMAKTAAVYYYTLVENHVPPDHAAQMTAAWIEGTSPPKV